MKKFFENNISKSWKTTMTGLAIGLLAFLNYIGTLTDHDVVMIISLLTSFGFLASKDGNISHTLFPTNEQPQKPKEK